MIRFPYTHRLATPDTKGEGHCCIQIGRLFSYSPSLIAVIIMAVLFSSSLLPFANASIFEQFCSAVRAGLAQGPQSSGCLLQGQQLQQGLQQSQLQQPFTNSANTVNPANAGCPSGTVLSGTFCVPTTTTTPTGCTTPPTVISPAIALATTASQVVSRGSAVTLDGSASTGSVTNVNCVQNTNTITAYSWSQTSGVKVTLSGATTAKPTFTASTNSTTLGFTLQVTDSAGFVSPASPPVFILVR